MAAQGLSCSTEDLWLQHEHLLVVACGIQFPDQGSNLGPMHWELRVLATRSPGKSLKGSTFNSDFEFYYILTDTNDVKLFTEIGQRNERSGLRKKKKNKKYKSEGQDQENCELFTIHLANWE